MVLPGSLYGIDNKPRESGSIRPLRLNRTDYSILLDKDFVGDFDLEDIVEALERTPERLGEGDLWLTPMPGVEASERRREALQADVEQYLANGGTITYCEPGEKSGVFDAGD